jgi:ABC-2 type transport system permease protein
MMGKIIGVALVGLTQFLLWIILSTVVISFVTTTFMSGKSDKEKMEQVSKMNPSMQGMQAQNQQMFKSKGEMMTDLLETIPVTRIIISFLFFFLGGYLLYSALFAAIGSAVDSETDTQQFMLPVTMPLILAYVVSATVMSNPNGAVAFWFSMIPLTSPIVMMLRVPFGVPDWQIGLSMVLLVLGFIFTTWFASRIYRVGILMYGKKVSYGELWKWFRYHN